MVSVELDETNLLDNFINVNQNEIVYILEDYKIVKLIEPAHILQTHIRNSSNNIYINSITHEIINDSMFNPTNVNQGASNFDELVKIQLNEIRNHTYLSYTTHYVNSYGGSLHTLENNNNTFTESINVDKNIFFCNHTLGCYEQHTIFNFFPLIYIYYILKKYIPDLLLIISYQNRYTEFLLNTLNISDYILIKHTQKIINTGKTYFASALTQNYTDNLINKYFYDIIVKQTLLSYQIKDNFPKKILFLRIPGVNTISSPDTLFNREEIVNIAKKYGYVDIDQTKLPPQELVYLVNNATHLITESGSAVLHLLWSKNIKAIILCYRKFM